MSSASPLRVAFAGVGSFSQRVLIPGLVACPDAEVVGLFGPTAEKTARIAQERGIPRAFSSYTQMLDETRPDAVAVATPNDIHAPMALEALSRGLHVFCEKPLGITLDEAERMAEAARRAGVRTAVNFTYRSTTATRHVKWLLDHDQIGALRHLNISFWQNIRADESVPLAYRMLRERGGGALLDIGVHMMDLLRWYFGEIEAVAGLATTAVAERPTVDGGTGQVTADDVASFVVRLRGGASGTVQVSQVAHGRQAYRRIEVFGSVGSLVMEEDRQLGPEVRYAAAGQTQYQVTPLPDDINVSFDEFPKFHAGRIVAALRGQNDDWPTFEDGLRAQRAVDAVERSQRTGRWVELG